MTYDHAVQEFGPPDRSAQLKDGGIVAEWLTERGGVMPRYDPYYGPYGPPYYRRHRYYSHYYPYGYGRYYSDVVFPDQYVRLTFDSEGILRAVKSFSR